MDNREQAELLQCSDLLEIC